MSEEKYEKIKGEDLEAETFGGNDDIWVMARQASSEKTTQLRVDPEALKNEEVRDKVSEAFAEMLEKVIADE